MKETARRQLTAAVILFFAFAAIGLVFATRGHIGGTEHAAQAARLLPGFTRTDLSQLALERQGTRVVLERDDDGSGFHVTAPMAQAARVEVVDALLQTIELATFQRKLDREAIDPQQAGFREPVSVLSFQTAKERTVLRLGKPSRGADSGWYLEVEADGGRTAYVVGKPVAEGLSINPNSLRHVQFLPYGTEEVQKLAYRSPELSTDFTRDSRGLWLNGGKLAERTSVRALFETLADMDQAAITDLEQAVAAQRGIPLTTIVLAPLDSQNPHATLLFGGPCPVDPEMTIARRQEPDPIAVCVLPSFLDRLSLEGRVLVSNRLFWMRFDEVQSLSIKAPAGSLVLERSEDGFMLRDPVRAKVTLDVGNQRLEAMTQLVGEPARANEALLPPITLVELESTVMPGEPSLTESLRVSSRDSRGRSLVERIADGSKFWLHERQAELLLPDSTLLKRLQVLDIPRHQIERVVLEGAIRQTIEQTAPGAFTLVEPSGVAADPNAAAAIFGALSELRAQRWVADDPSPSHGLSSPRLTATLIRGAALAPSPSQPTRTTLRVGARTARGFFAEVDSNSGVFVLPEAAFQALTTWAHDRTICQVSPEAARKVTLTRGSRAIVLEARGDLWFAEDEQGRELPGVAAEALDALGALTAEGVVHAGRELSSEGLREPLITVSTELRAPTPAQGASNVSRCSIGTGDSWNHLAVHYLRRESIDATFAVARSKVDALLRLFGE